MMHRSLKCLFLAGAVLCADIPVAGAHAFLDTANPAVGATLKSPPAEVSITFTEALEPAFSRITVVDESGQRVDLGNDHAASDNPMRFSVGLKALKPGSYKVLWQVTSVDTHKTKGSYAFTIAP